MENKKCIILCAPKAFGIDNEIYDHLTKLGFDVIYLSFNSNFTYTPFERIINFLLKTFFSKHDYKKSIAFQRDKDFWTTFNLIEKKADYALVFRSDLYPKSILKAIKNKANKFIAYQWDNFRIFPEGKRYISLFDTFYTFDPYDVDLQKGIFPATNFYFQDDALPNETLAPSVYFLGSLYPNKMDRVALVSSILKITRKLNYQQNIYFFNTDKIKGVDSYQSQGINFIKHPISYNESLANTKKATLLIDILGGKNKGLYFRVFEALNYGKKLITNNVEIKKYDFYNSSNIYVIENDNTDNLKDFLLLPYEDIPQEIKGKYCFDNWIHYILNLEPYTPIILPK